MNIKNFQTLIQNFSFLEKNFFDLVNQEKQISEKWIDLFKSEDILNSEILFNNLNSDQSLNSNDNIFENFIEEIKKIFRKLAYMFANLNPISEDAENIENRKIFLLKIKSKFISITNVIFFSIVVVFLLWFWIFMFFY